MKDLMSLIIAPIFVGLVLEMISRVLDEEDDSRESKLLSTHTLGVATSVKKSNPIRCRIAFCVICTI